MKNRIGWVCGCILLLAFIVAGCGDSDGDFTTTQQGNNSSNIQVQFSRANVLAQTAEFSAATHYAVDVVNAGTRDYVRPTTFVAANTAQDQQVILLTGVPVGVYDVIVTSFSNGVQTAQVLARSVNTSTGNTTLVGNGGGAVSLTPNTGAPYVVNFPGGQGPNTTTGGTSGGYTTTGGTTGGYTTTGGYGN